MAPAVGPASPRQLQDVVRAMAEGLMVRGDEMCLASADGVMVTEQAVHCCICILPYVEEVANLYD